jgi:alpha-tubulin suppressor-like RCC1 family protein
MNRIRLAVAAVAAALLLLPLGCAGIFGIHELPPGGDDASPDGTALDATLSDGSSAEGDAADVQDVQQDVQPDVQQAEASSDAKGDGDATGPAMCDPPNLSCDAGCVPSDDLHNCGACGNDCTALDHVASASLSCTGGRCVYTCASGFADCADAGIGCAVSLGENPNCGACGTTCSGSTSLCSNGTCTSMCSGTTPDLCGSTCTNKQSDPQNCGVCGMMCPTGTTCAVGQCVCNTSSGCGGCCSGNSCISVANESADAGPGCGTGGNTCAACPIAGEVCNGGGCACGGGLTQCGSACVDEQTDSMNCGACNHACPSVAPTCQNGGCQCPVTGQSLCGSACVDEQTDPSNCGACGKACAATCNSGQCTSATALALGGFSACAVLSGGTAQCWGDNRFGELGDVTTTGPAQCGGQACSLGPVSIKSSGTTALTGVTALSMGLQTACAMLLGGTVSCWGSNATGTLGDGTATAPNTCLPGLFNAPCTGTPGAVAGLGSQPTAISVGDESACALFSGGTVQCWGDNTFGEMGTGSATGPNTCSGEPCATTPVTVGGASALTGVTAISVGSGFACALMSGGTVECWGDNADGQMGLGLSSGPQKCNGGATSCSTNPHTVPGLSNVVQMSAGGATACAVTSGGNAWCWGYNSDGQLGNGTTTGPDGGDAFSASPVEVMTGVVPLGGVTSVAVGTNGTVCAVLSGGTVDCWGNNMAGELGDGTSTGPDSCGGYACSTTPVAVKGLSGVTAVSVSADSACALLPGGFVQCWGGNSSGELGINSASTTQSTTPVPVVW